MKHTYDVPKEIQDALFTLEEYFDSDIGVIIQMCDGFYTVQTGDYHYKDETEESVYENSYVVSVREFSRDYTEDGQKKIIEWVEGND